MIWSVVSVTIVGGGDFLSGPPTAGIGDWFSRGVNETTGAIWGFSLAAVTKNPAAISLPTREQRATTVSSR